MTVVTAWDLFEDLRDAQDEMLRLNRLRAPGLGQPGHYYSGGAAKPASTPCVLMTVRASATTCSRVSVRRRFCSPVGGMNHSWRELASSTAACRCCATFASGHVLTVNGVHCTLTA